MPETQVPFRELLKDPVYRAWLAKPPKRRPKQVSNGPTWRVWVKMPEHRWTHRDFYTYKEAYRWAMPRLKFMEDMAIGCTNQEFKPPIVRVGWRKVNVVKTDPRTGQKTKVPKRVPVRKFLTELPDRLPSGHHWCGYCRRPTVFGYFKRHHGLPGRIPIPHERRCRVCGVRLGFLGRWSQ